MADSKYSIDRKCIFRETFNSEQEVRRNGGTPTAVTFANGKGTFNGTAGNKIIFSKYPLKGVYSVRIKTIPTNFSTQQFLVNFLNSAVLGTGYIYSDNITGTITKTSGTVYINGVATSLRTVGVLSDIIVSGITLDPKGMRIGCSHDGTSYPLNATIDLFEIYEGTLTAEEVKNLYNNKRHFDLPATGHGEQLSAEMVDQAAWYTAAYWNVTFDANWSQLGTTLVSNGGTGDVRRNAFWTIGRRYKVTITITRAGGTLYPPGDGAAAPTALTVTGTYSYYYTPITTNLWMLSLSNFNGTVTALSIKEVLVNSTKEILNVNAIDGVIRNKYSNGGTIPAVVNTATEVVRENDVYAMKFNGTTSKIDCGSYDTLVGDKTFIAWVKPYSFGGIGKGRIFDNGKLVIAIFGSSAYIVISSNGLTSSTSAVNSVHLDKYQFVAVTRSSTGITNIYINRMLSGTANQTSGTPEVGTTNTIVGNNTGQIITFDGLISTSRIIDGLLTPAEISQIYTSEKHLYGL